MHEFQVSLGNQVGFVKKFFRYVCKICVFREQKTFIVTAHGFIPNSSYGSV